MTLATKYLSHPSFIPAAIAANNALREVAAAFDVEQTLNNYETAAGNVVDDMTRLILIMIDAKAAR